MIYPKYFPKGNDYFLSEEKFEEAVINAYKEIIRLIPGLNGKGNADEDHYMSEWIVQNRHYFYIQANDNVDNLAYRIYLMRANHRL